MPSLAGLFGRKKKNSVGSNRGPNSSANSEFDSAPSSPTAEYVTPDRSMPSSPNGRSNLHPDSARRDPSSNVYPSLATSSSKLRLPFGRKKVSAAASTTSVVTTLATSHDSTFDTPPRPAYLSTRTGAVSETDVDLRRLRPPPSKSAIFAAYGDPHSALSTRSLPNEPIQNGPAPIPPPVPPKKPSFFHWSKSTPSSPHTTLQKSRPSISPTQLSPTSPTSDSSFNLKSFRHVIPPSPNESNMSLALPIPRPRGASIASESSQRISVAAFREAQARRSTAGSPVPSNRAPSPFSSGGYPDVNVRGNARPSPQPSKSPSSRPNGQHRRMSGLAYTSDSDESSEEEDSDGSVSPQQRSHRGGGVVRRKRTVTQHNGAESSTLREPIKGRATKSEIGHGSSHVARPSRRDIIPAERSQSSHILMSQYPGRQSSNEANGNGESSHSRSQSSLGFDTGGSRPRASVSTSAISPSAAAKRASIIAAANSNPHANGKHHVRASSAYSNPGSAPVFPEVNSTRRAASSSSSDDSEDDAPLATLVAPRRPGSAMSSASNLHSASRSNVNLNGSTRAATAQKPLIDITELTHARTRPSKGLSNDGFTPGATLIGGRGLTTSPTAMSHPTSPIHNSPIPTSTSPPTHFISPPSSPAKEHMQFITTSPTLRSSSGMPVSSSSSAGRVPPRSETSPVGRDMLGERLTRVVQLKAGSGSSARSSSTSGSGSTSGSRSASIPIPGVSNGSAAAPRTTPFNVAKTLSPPLRQASTQNNLSSTNISPPEEDLATLLGAAGINLISRNGESESDSEEDDDSEDDDEGDDTDKDVTQEPDRIAPIPIKQRAPPPAFSVTSRPPLHKAPGDNDNGSNARTSIASIGPAVRQRSTTLIPASTSSSHPTSAPPISTKVDSGQVAAITPRQRSTTMLPTSTTTAGIANAIPMPARPFVPGRRNSPVSSIGDSSSGRAPFTPKDGSEIGSTAGGRGGGREADSAKDDGWSGGVSGLGLKSGAGKHIKRHSVSFEEDLRNVSGGVKGKETHGDGEERRRERRRSEAKAAIELGNVINGRGPIVEDDDDDLPINQTIGGGARMSAVNPLMAMGAPMTMPMNFGAQAISPPGWNGMNMNGWQQPNPQMLSPQFIPPPSDPSLMLAHQQAMMYAKQAYQMAVAQQAMAAAGDEWERGSTVGGFGGGGSVYGGGGSVYGGGGGSVYGGGGSVYGGGVSSASMLGSPYGMGMSMGGMQSPANGWSTGSVIMPGPSRSMYGGVSGARSDYGSGGGGGGGGQWNSSKSSYGESFGPSSNRFSKAGSSQGRPVYGQRDSGYFPPVPPIPQNSGSGSPSARSGGTPRSRTASQPASPGRGVRKVGPPSSWKTSGV